MKVVFRVDSSVAIGSGHVMRCLTLADELSSKGDECHFICQAVPGNLLEYIGQRGHSVHALQSDAAIGLTNWEPDAEAAGRIVKSIRPDWLVVDHYCIGARWETALRPHCRKILVIDDLANRAHDCDALLDQNVHVDASDRYATLVPPNCARFIGPEFALLRPEFVRARAALGRRRRRFAAPSRLHVFFGGSDPTGETLRTMKCLPQAARSLSIDVVIGAQNPDRERITSLATQLPNASVAVQVSAMADHIAEADVAVGACGSAALERCCLGLPTLTLVTADNQRQLAAGLAHHGAIVLLRDAASVSEEALADAIAGGLRDTDLLQSVSAAGMDLFPNGVDGARRLASMMEVH